jgi:hypothetical protein
VLKSYFLRLGRKEALSEEIGLGSKSELFTFPSPETSLDTLGLIRGLHFVLLRFVAIPQDSAIHSMTTSVLEGAVLESREMSRY